MNKQPDNKSEKSEAAKKLLEQRQKNTGSISGGSRPELRKPVGKGIFK